MPFRNRFPTELRSPWNTSWIVKLCVFFVTLDIPSIRGQVSQNAATWTPISKSCNAYDNRQHKVIYPNKTDDTPRQEQKTEQCMRSPDIFAEGLRSVRIGLNFLTIFKINIDPIPELKEVGRSSWAFPLVGAIIGVLLCLAFRLIDSFFSPFLSAVLVVGLWAFLTGGLHLDGWTDCWDALAASVTQDRRMEILKDSRMGTFGALGLMFLLAVKVGALAVSDMSLAEVFAAPAVGRGFMVFSTYGSRHRGEGMAAMFLAGVDERAARLALIIALAAALFAGLAGLLAAAIAYAAAFWFRQFAENRLPSINGDVMGGICELSETVFLLICSMR
jgi:adenosylcobinamide-GDP ribazoletransferase